MASNLYKAHGRRMQGIKCVRLTPVSYTGNFVLAEKSINQTMTKAVLFAASFLALTGASKAFAAPQEIALSGATPDLKTLQLDSPHVYDYTFAVAPTDWRIASGLVERATSTPLRSNTEHELS